MDTLTVVSPAAVEVPTAADLLRRAAYLVAQPGAWCQHSLARTEDGRKTFVLTLVGEDTFRSRCLLGALYCEHKRYPKANIRAAYEAIVKALGTSCIAEWNDARERTQAQVADALMRASEIAEVPHEP